MGMLAQFRLTAEVGAATAETHPLVDTGDTAASKRLVLMQKVIATSNDGMPLNEIGSLKSGNCHRNRG